MSLEEAQATVGEGWYDEGQEELRAIRSPPLSGVSLVFHFSGAGLLVKVDK